MKMSAKKEKEIFLGVFAVVVVFVVVVVISFLKAISISIFQNAPTFVLPTN